MYLSIVMFGSKAICQDLFLTSIVIGKHPVVLKLFKDMGTFCFFVWKRSLHHHSVDSSEDIL